MHDWNWCPDILLTKMFLFFDLVLNFTVFASLFVLIF